MLKRLAKRSLGRVLNLAGRAYVPGYRLEDAEAVAARLERQGMACTLGYFHTSCDTPAQVAEIACVTMDALAVRKPEAYVSIKAPAMGYDPQLIATILGRARALDRLVHFDSHELHTRDPTLACMRQAVGLGGRVGITLPGRWRRSLEDAEDLAGLGVRVRVVKGEWADPQQPGRDPRQGFLDVIDRLAGRASEVAVATHDAELARASLQRLVAAGTPCEMELLNGLPRRDLLPIARELAIPVRIYIPFGVAWRPYALNKLGQNPRMVQWLLLDSLRGLWGTMRRRD